MKNFITKKVEKIGFFGNRTEKQRLINGNSSHQDNGHVSYATLEDGRGVMSEGLRGQFKIVHANSTVEPQSKLNLVGSFSFLALLLALGILANFSSFIWGSKGFREFLPEKDGAEKDGDDIAGYGALASNVLTNTKGVAGVIIALALAVYACVKDPHQRRPKQMAKSFVKVALSAPPVAAACIVTGEGNRKALYDINGKPLYPYSALSVNAATYSSLGVNYFFPMQLVNKIMGLIGLLGKRKINTQQIVFNTFNLVEKEIKRSAEKNPKKFFKIFAAYNNAATMQERFDIISNIAGNILENMKDNENLSAFDDDKSTIKKLLGDNPSITIANLLIGFVSAIGVLMTFAKIGLTISPALFDILVPHFLFDFLKEIVPNIVSAICSAGINAAENFIFALDLLPTILEICTPSNWLHLISSGGSQIAFYIISGLISIVGSLLNALSQLGMALEFPLFGEGNIWSLVQAVTSFVGGLGLAALGFKAFFKDGKEKIEDTIWSKIIGMNAEELNNYYKNELTKAQRVRMVDVVLRRFQSALEVLKENLETRDAEVLNHLVETHDKKPLIEIAAPEDAEPKSEMEITVVPNSSVNTSQNDSERDATSIDVLLNDSKVAFKYSTMVEAGLRRRAEKERNADSNASKNLDTYDNDSRNSGYDTAYARV